VDAPSAEKKMGEQTFENWHTILRIRGNNFGAWEKPHKTCPHDVLKDRLEIWIQI